MQNKSKLAYFYFSLCDLSHPSPKSYGIVYYLVFLLFLFSHCSTEKVDSTSENKGKLTVAVAANMQFAMKEIETTFEEIENTAIHLIIGSSGKLTAQILQGAPYDLLVAANMKYPNHLYQKGHAPNEPKIYGLGALVLWSLKDGLVLDSTLSILTKPIVQKIAIANPKNAPYGEQAIKAFDYFKIKSAITPKLVYAENIAQTNQYILSKNCEVGLTAKSVVFAPQVAGKGTWIEVPKKAYQAINQGVVVTKYGVEHHPDLAQRFYDFLFSEQAEEIFLKYGYEIPSLKNKNGY